MSAGGGIGLHRTFPYGNPTPANRVSNGLRNITGVGNLRDVTLLSRISILVASFRGVIAAALW